MIDQRRLEVLRTFARRGTMSAAADALYLSTSAVSQHLKALEHEVGTALIERHGRRAALTEAGAALVRYADEIAELSESAMTTMHRFSGTVRGVVRVSAFPSFASAVLPGVVSEVRDAFPELEVHVSDLESFESIEALRAGTVDLAVIDDLNPVDRHGLSVSPVGSDELVLCAPADMLLPSGPIQVADLRDARWLLDGSQEVFDDYLHRLCADHQFEPHVVARCRNVTVTLALVEAGVGVALLSGMHVRKESFTVVTRSLAPMQQRLVQFARRRSSQRSHLIDAIQQVLEAHASTRLPAIDREV